MKLYQHFSVSITDISCRGLFRSTVSHLYHKWSTTQRTFGQSLQIGKKWLISDQDYNIYSEWCCYDNWQFTLHTLATKINGATHNSLYFDTNEGEKQTALPFASHYEKFSYRKKPLSVCGLFKQLILNSASHKHFCHAHAMVQQTSAKQMRSSHQIWTFVRRKMVKTHTENQ